MTSQPITRSEWWIGIALVLAALTILGLYVMRVVGRIEAVNEPRLVPVASAAPTLH
jgi:Na+-transporting methylmalonyl-CoA/oxaloacetate decarboxylase gamma subunit